LLTVAVLPLLYGFGEGRTLTSTGASWALASGSVRSAISIPASWALFAFLAWTLGAGIAMARLASGLWRLRQLRRSCTPIVVEDLDAIVRPTVDSIIASGSVTIATSDCMRVPAAIGFWKRTVVLPTWTLQELPSEDLNVILLHEFAHLRRGDDWTNLIQKVVRALFFFHPAVWWIESRLSVEREMACDDAVLAETANPHAYATCLVSLLEKSLAHRGWSMAQAAVHRAREASLRLAQILDKNRPVATRVWMPALGMVGASFMVCLVALSQAPQFVAVDHGTAGSLGQEHSAAVSELLSQARPSTKEEPSVPAGLDGRDARRSTTRSHAAAGRRLAAATVVAARVDAEPPREQVLAVNAMAEQQLMPQFQTLVFVQTTQYMTSGPVLWRVQVWRVMVVNPEQERAARVPLANKI
jgi:beta-lactamase regulating signal transducer with metallopeptidase domain